MQGTIKFLVNIGNTMNTNLQIVVFWAATLFLILFLLVWVGECSSQIQEERDRMRAENPEQYNRENLCLSKVSGSRPACWNEGDWIAFCRKVKCMEDKE